MGQLVSFCADIGPKDRSWTDDEIFQIESEFPEEHLPREKRRQYLKDNVEDEEAFDIYRVVLDFNDVIICLGRDMSAIISNGDEENVRSRLEEVVIRLDKRFPEKNLELCKLWPVARFERISKPQNDAERRQFSRGLIIFIVSSVAVGVTIALVTHFLGYIPYPDK